MLNTLLYRTLYSYYYYSMTFQSLVQIVLILRTHTHKSFTQTSNMCFLCIKQLVSLTRFFSIDKEPLKVDINYVIGQI